MLENLDDEIAKMPGDKLVAFHIIGSHGPTYYLRYPAEHRHFMPECARSRIVKTVLRNNWSTPTTTPFVIQTMY